MTATKVTRSVKESPTSSELTFSCTCPKPYGLPFPIVMNTTTVGSGGSVVYSWTGFHNDSLGLNACAWDCTATQTNGTPYAQTSFSTGWGECLKLSADPGGVLTKS